MKRRTLLASAAALGLATAAFAQDEPVDILWLRHSYFWIGHTVNRAGKPYCAASVRKSRGKVVLLLCLHPVQADGP